MTKTELKRQQVARAIDLLENGFDATFTGDDEGGRLGFIVAGFTGDFSRRDLNVALWESIPLSGHGFTPAEILAQQEAVALENQINDAIQVAVFGYHG